MHECPDCGRLCTCGGDIDDIDWGEDVSCECDCWKDDFEDDDYDVD